MSSATSSISSNSFLKSIWSDTVTVAASGLAIIPVFRRYVLKSDQQRGLPSPTLLPFRQGIQMGIRAAPATALAAGFPPLVQRHIELLFQGEEGKTTWRTLFLSSAVVGALSTPVLLIFEGRSLKQGVWASLKHASCPRQYCAFALQEIGFVAGVSTAKHVDRKVREYLDIQENPLTTYASAAAAGGMGAAAGHAGNTVSTRLRSKLPINYRSIRQLNLGFVPRTGALMGYSLLYHLFCNTFDPGAGG